MADYGHYPDSTGEINQAILNDKRFGLTPQMRVLMNFIERFSGEHGGVMPSYDEMKTALGLNSKSGVHRLVESLVERGYIIKKGHRARSIQLVVDNGASDEHRLSAAIKIVLNGAVLSHETRCELYGIGRTLDANIPDNWRRIGTVAADMIGGAK